MPCRSRICSATDARGRTVSWIVEPCIPNSNIRTIAAGKAETIFTIISYIFLG